MYESSSARERGIRSCYIKGPENRMRVGKPAFAMESYFSYEVLHCSMLRSRRNLYPLA